jgi:tubulin polyglutamylase TTLL4
MNKFQKINHFPGCWNLGRKDYMWKNLNKQRRSHPDAYNFVPNTYLFPADFERFEMCRETAEKSKLWIMKPTNQACGRGIKMVTKDTDIRNKKDMLVSEYIANPHLINNFKYDLRIYVLVTSYDPLRIYMFKEGLTRFATYEYNAKTKDVGKRFIHLTNFSVNKHSKKFVKNTKEERDGEGSKWSLTALKKHYESMGINS